MTGSLGVVRWGVLGAPPSWVTHVVRESPERAVLSSQPAAPQLPWQRHSRRGAPASDSAVTLAAFKIVFRPLVISSLGMMSPGLIVFQFIPFRVFSFLNLKYVSFTKLGNFCAIISLSIFFLHNCLFSPSGAQITQWCPFDATPQVPEALFIFPQVPFSPYIGCFLLIDLQVHWLSVSLISVLLGAYGGNRQCFLKVSCDSNV